MSTLAEKLQAGRKAAKLNRTEFAEKVGISRRSEFSYENGTLFPSPTTIRKLADALGVTEYYLTHDECEDPDADRAREDSLKQARQQFGSKGAREAAKLLERSSAFFAGGDIPQEDKDALFEALMTAYVTAKTEAREKFTPKSIKAAEKKK